VNFNYIFDRIPCYLPDDECWEYQGYLNLDGYGSAHLSWRGSNVLAHRLMYEQYYDETLSKSEVVRHTCDNPSCCNPFHLIKGTQADNVADMIERERFPDRAGESNGRAVITEELAKDLRKLYASGMWSYGLLAQLFDLKKTTVAYLIKGKSWKHLLT